MISIVIPVYNGERYIGECIESVLSQTYTDYELIVVDDGSTDETQKIALDYQKKNPDKMTVYLKGNGGTASALNLGIEKMNGNWFKWLSADDKFSSIDSLKNMMTMISTIPNHKQYLFYTDYEIIDEDSQYVRKFIEPDRTDRTRDLRNAELIHNFYGNGSSSIIHKSLIDVVGPFRTLPFGEDLEYWLRLCLKFKYTMYHLPIITIQYRIHKSQLTNRVNVRRNLDFKKAIHDEYEQYLTPEQKQYIKQLNSQRPLRRKILHRLPSPLKNTAVNLYRKVR